MLNLVIIPNYHFQGKLFLRLFFSDYYFFCSSDQINEWGVRVHVAGRLSLLPKDLQALVSKAMLVTRNNNKLRLNIAYAYTGNNMNKWVIHLFYFNLWLKRIMKPRSYLNIFHLFMHKYHFPIL